MMDKTKNILLNL